MNIYEDTNPRELKELLYHIHNGDMVLPDFQRDFVWDAGMTMELIISIAENYPAGSLLRIRNTQNLFAYREFEGAPPINGRRPIYLTLDGQQRLTSLYQAFYGVGENRFYLNLRRLLDGGDFEDCVFGLRIGHRRVAEYELIELQARELILPLSVLRGGAGEYHRWVRNVARLQADDVARIALEDRLYEVDGWVQAIDDYRFPVVTLSDGTSAEAVCTIFETLNRTGVKLSPFELLTARFWHQGLNLRRLWAEAQETYPIIADFNVDPYYLLQIIALLGRARPSIKRNDVMNLEKTTIDEHWPAAVDGLRRALAFLQGECGVLTPDLLPYNTLLVPLAAIFARLRTLSGPRIGAARDKVYRWFWCAVFGQRYESSPSSLSVVDFVEVLRWIEGGDEPEAVAGLRFEPAILREVTTRQRAVYRGVLALVLRNRSRDFHSHEALTLEIIRRNHVDDHHIFPNKFLERLGVAARSRDCVLNHTLIDRQTNQRISDRAPAVYIAEIGQERGEAQFCELLSSHLLPTPADGDFFARNDFEGFLDWRQARIWAEIQAVTTG